MSLLEENITWDRFLGGRICAAQPANGFRAGHDSVFVAAAVPARVGQTVLELGSGAGIASLCLAARVDCRITGIERDASLVALAQRSAEKNGFVPHLRFEQGDIRALPDDMFDHVFCNPPFHPSSSRPSPLAARQAAKQAEDLVQWRDAALSRVRASVSMIIRADRLDEVLAGQSGGEVLLLKPRPEQTAKRAVIRLWKTEYKSGIREMILHAGNGRPSEEAEAVMRHAAELWPEAGVSRDA